VAAMALHQLAEAVPAFEGGEEEAVIRHDHLLAAERARGSSLCAGGTYYCACGWTPEHLAMGQAYRARRRRFGRDARSW
jgi:hypothetical protein